MNSEHPTTDLQDDPADADVHEFIFTHAGISGQMHFPSLGQLPRAQHKPQTGRARGVPLQAWDRGQQPTKSRWVDRRSTT